MILRHAASARKRITEMRMIVLASALFLSAGFLSAGRAFAQPLDCAGPEDPTASGVYAARVAFNQAIAEKDIDAIRAVLADDVLLVTGTDSVVFDGRSEQLSIWQTDFEAAERAIYERTTTCVSMSPLFPIALETGTWRGVRTEDANDFAAGSYAAKWRNIDGAWRLEAEIYSTETCGGSFCPGAENDE